jgi:malonyl-CoA O-methyltransferase
MATSDEKSPTKVADVRALARLVQRWGLAGHVEPWLHAEVARRMGERLPLFSARPKHVVQWWGPADGCEVLRAAYPDADLRVARSVMAATPTPRRTAWWHRMGSSRVAVIADNHVGMAQAQVLWANMVLHASGDANQLLKRWHDALEVGGTLMFSTIGPDTLRELRGLYRARAWGPHAAEVIDMHDVGDALMHAGFADPVMDQERLTLHWADPEALLAELRTLGINAAVDRHRGLRTRRWRAALIDGLSSFANPDGRIALSFEIVYGHAFKVAPRSTGSSTVALDTLVAELPSRRRS